MKQASAIVRPAATLLAVGLSQPAPNAVAADDHGNGKVPGVMQQEELACRGALLRRPGEGRVARNGFTRPKGTGGRSQAGGGRSKK
jgi:hypothetical protein